MPDFVSCDSYHDFSQSVKRKARYVFEKHVDEFLKTVAETCKERERKLSANSLLWRAQHGNDWRTFSIGDDISEEPIPFRRARMKPRTDSAREGRINPKGIPYLYLATDKETAMAEVRPWLGSYISVGRFKTLKDLIIIDCSIEHASGCFIYLEEPVPDERKRAVWREIDKAFSEPINQEESTADYAPTQILAEIFRQRGYDGIRYKSLLGEGFNIALFDLGSADLSNCHLYEVKKVSFSAAVIST